MSNASSSPTLTNVLFWNSSYSLPLSPTEGNFAFTGTTGDVNDPFVDSESPNGPDGVPRTADDGLRIKSTATIINLGVPITGTANPLLDILGLARVGRPEPGAYEYTP